MKFKFAVQTTSYERRLELRNITLKTLNTKLKSVKSYSALNRWKSSVTGWRICALTEDTGEEMLNDEGRIVIVSVEQ